MALPAVIAVLGSALVLRLLAAWCAFLLGVPASVILVTLVGEPVSLVAGISACLAGLKSVK